MMRQLFRSLGSVLALLEPTWLTQSLTFALRHLRTGYLSRRLQHVGQGSVFLSKVRIIGGENISIGDNTVIGRYTILSTWSGVEGVERPSLVIGNRVSIPDNCHITAARSIAIGNDVLFGKQVTVTDNSHGTTQAADLALPPNSRRLQSKGPVIINDRVWIGDKATVLPGVTIGEGAVIGANSVVTHDVPPYTVFVGRQIHKTTGC